MSRLLSGGHNQGSFQIVLRVWLSLQVFFFFSLSKYDFINPRKTGNVLQASHSLPSLGLDTSVLAVKLHLSQEKDKLNLLCRLDIFFFTDQILLLRQRKCINIKCLVTPILLPKLVRKVGFLV